MVRSVTIPPVTRAGDARHSSAASGLRFWGMIDDPVGIDVMKIKRKSLSFHIEFMFARSMWETADMDAQHRLLNRVADLVDAGKLATTAARNLGPMNAATLKDAHALQESGRAVGKTVLTAIQ